MVVAMDHYASSSGIPAPSPLASLLRPAQIDIGSGVRSGGSLSILADHRRASSICWARNDARIHNRSPATILFRQAMHCLHKHACMFWHLIDMTKVEHSLRRDRNRQVDATSSSMRAGVHRRVILPSKRDTLPATARIGDDRCQSNPAHRNRFIFSRITAFNKQRDWYGDRRFHAVNRNNFSM